MDALIYNQLHEPQKEAFDKMVHYIGKHHSGDTSGSGLVQMPTGSGKTGIIACLSRLVPSITNVMIVAPRVALREQLFREVNGAFFNKIGYTGLLPKEIEEVNSGNAFTLSGTHPKVFITTVQKLHTLKTDKPADFKNLLPNIQLVIFDEGHYEPALEWSSTIREFNCPKIVFTATPFRNDFKPFDIDYSHIYSYPFYKAVSTNLLRDVTVIDKTPINNPNDFIDDVLTEYDKIFTTAEERLSRIIIRCDDSPSIRRLATVLIHKGENFIGIHENFVNTPTEAWAYKNVPDPNHTDAKIWIHQYKLLEGIDDSRFRLLATFEPLKNTRKIIQQVGRILRNPGKQPNQLAYFLDHSGGIQKKLWNEYIEYDKNLETNLTVSISTSFVKNVLDNLPTVDYVDRRFRNKFDISVLFAKIYDEIQLPLRCSIISTLPAFTNNGMCELIEKRFGELDFVFQPCYDLGGGVFVYLYLALKNSQFLINTYSLNANLNVCLFKKLTTNHVAFLDTLGYIPLNEEKYGLGKALDSLKLKQLLSEDDKSRMTRVSLKNSNIGNKSILSHSFSASSINNTTPFLDDHAQVLSSVNGYSFEKDHPIVGNDKYLRRYVGFKKGKISEGGEYHQLDEYLKWLNHIDSILKGNRGSLNTFKRYSLEKENVSDTTPEHILLDFSEIEELRFKTVDDDEREVDFEDLACKITKDVNGKFKFCIKETESSLEYDVFIEYDNKRKKYVLSSPSISGTFFCEGGLDLIKYLNDFQSFRVLPKESNCIYVNGNFYNPAIKIGSEFKAKDSHVINILCPDNKLLSSGNEKGVECETDESNWEKDSLFRLIDEGFDNTKLAKYFANSDILICDDMQTEVADFILSGSEKVVFIHVKGVGAKGKTSHCSASKLQEVCGQATKNIQFLSMFNELKPSNLTKWNKEWKSSKTTIGKVSSRIRKGKNLGSPSKLWSIIQGRIRNPAVDKEVWLVLGKILCHDEFIRQLKKDEPVHEAVQAAILLHGTLTNIASIGAKLRVFCHKSKR